MTILLTLLAVVALATAIGAYVQLLNKMKVAKLRIEADVRASRDLDRVASMAFPENAPLEPVLSEVLAAAIAISGADFGSVQLLDPRTSQLRVVVHRGLPTSWVEFWDSASRGQGACGTALERGERVIIEDVEQSPIFANTAASEIQGRAGIRAVQSTPLFSRSGEPIGMFSTHYRTPHRPDARTLCWLDLLARQAADIIERARAETRRERQLREMIENSPHAIAMLDHDMRYVQVSPRFLQDFSLGADVIGKSHHEVVELPERYKELNRRCLAGATEQHEGEQFKGRDGIVRWIKWKVCPWREADDTIGGILIYTEDITALRSAVESVRAMQELLSLGQRIARIGTFEWNIQTGISTWTPELEHMYGLPTGGFEGTREAWAMLVHPDDRAEASRRVDSALATGEPTEGEWRARAPDGTTHWLAARFQAFMDDTGKPQRLVGVNIDITERKQIEEQRERLLAEVRDLSKNLEARVAERAKEVALARDRLEGIISTAADAIILIVENERIALYNRGAEDVFGWSLDEVLGKRLDLLLPGALGKDSIEAHNQTTRTEMIGRRKNGETFPVEVAISKQPTDRGCQFTVIVRDITGRRNLEEERARTYAERAVLLKEIHHRVKNNLQVISSLFYLQEHRTDQPAVRALLDESRSRLYTIALIHDKLYRSEQLAAIELGDYLKDLTKSLTKAIGSPGVSVRVDADHVFLDVDRAIPCALIANELVTNAMKHAFPDERSGEICISIRAVKSDFILEVSDTGVGFPVGLDFTKVTTLGLQLVGALAHQLNGSVELKRGRGTTFAIRFPSGAAAQRSAQLQASC